MERKTKIGVYAAYIYLLLPFILFAGGWLKTWLAAILLILLALSLWKMLQHAPALWRPEFTRENIEKIAVIFGVICLWVYLSGIGKVVFQNTDHTARNAIFDILVQYDWPVIETSADGNSVMGLIYYIGFWLPSAVVGKIFGIQAGYHAQMIWAAVGILLFYYFICARSKKLEVWPLIVLIFFSGLDYIGYYLLGSDMSTITNTLHLEWWNDPYQISSMTTQLFWVFNQCIPAWVATSLLLNTKDNRSVIIIWATTMLTSTLPFVGLLPIVVYLVFTRSYEGIQNKLQSFVRNLFTIENVIGGGIVGIISFLYLQGNFSGSAIGTSGHAVKEYGYDGTLMMWMLTVILEVGIYFLLIYKKERNNKLFYLILVELCLFPLIRVGSSNDFCMRAVIPAQVILLIFVIDALRELLLRKQKGMLLAFLIVIGIGSITPIHEITRTVSETVQRQREGVQVEEETNDYNSIMQPGNFAGEVSDNIFFKYVVK